MSFSKTVHASEPLLHPDLPEVPIYESISNSEANSLSDTYTDKLDDSVKTFSITDRYYNSAKLGLVTPVKNQNPYGTCWTFSAVSACETSMIKRGLYDNRLDLSEFHLAYFFFHPQTDPLGGTADDSFQLKSSTNFMNVGGTDACTMFALSKWSGAALESLAPYPNSTTIPKLDSSLAYEDFGHLQNVRYVSGADQESIKRLILQYGSVSAPVHMDLDRYYSASTAAYYCSNTVATNHQVTLVGWDDDYSINNFTNGIRPSSRGAWIVKNSYDTTFGDNGYMYISYYDKSLTQQKSWNNSSESLVFAYDMESRDNYSNNYQYDGSASCTYMTAPSGSSFANIFTVKGNPSGQERLDAVSFSVASPNVQYAIQIYKNPVSGNPTSGIAVFDQAQTGITTYCGYYTIELNQKVVFNQGDTYSVVISLSSPDNKSIHCFVDQTSSLSSLHFISTAHLGESYYYTSMTGWMDLVYYGNLNNRIKAFTTNTSQPATLILPNISELPKPTIQSIKVRTADSITLSWDSVVYADGYQILRSTSKNGKYITIADTASTSFHDTTVVPGKKYYYRVVAYGKSRYRGILFSPASLVRSKSVLPGAVKITQLKKKNTQAARLTWKKVSGANGYEIYKKSSDHSWKRIKRLKRGSTTSTSVSYTPKKRCTYRIRAYKAYQKKKFYGAYSKTKRLN